MKTQLIERVTKRSIVAKSCFQSRGVDIDVFPASFGRLLVKFLVHIFVNQFRTGI